MKNIDTLKQWASAYYNDQPMVSDDEYDALYDTLKAKYPNDAFFNTVGASTQSEAVDLPYQMGSLNKVNPYTITDFIKPKGVYLVTPKFDGLTCQLIYKNGKLKAAYTRGNGYQGQPILTRAKYIGGIPKTLPTSLKGEIEVEGELIIYKSVFNKLYKGEFAHPRNFCVGTLRPKVSEKEYQALIDKDSSVKDRLKYMQFIAFKVRGLKSTSKYDSLLTLKGWGFSTSVQPSKKWSDANFKTYKSEGRDALCKCKRFELPFMPLPRTSDLTTDWFKAAIDGVKSSKFDVACDGVVIEYDDLNKQKKMGLETNSLNPKFARAVKHIQKEQTGKYTTVQDIEWNMSKRGNFVPTLVLDPIELEGSTISRVSGNNIDMLKKQGISVGAKIKIVRSGDVIPYIVDVSKTSAVEYPKKCPYCGTKLTIEGVHLHCPNAKCNGRKAQEVQGFFQIAKCDGVSGATINDFMLAGYSLKKILTLKTSDITCLEGYKAKSAANIVKAIKTMRGSLYLCNLMHALGYFNTAQTGLGATKLQSIIDFLGAQNIYEDNVKQSKLNKLGTIAGIAQKSADIFISNYSKFQSKFQSIKSLFDLLDFKEVELASTKLDGMSFCFTGARDHNLEKVIVDNGGTVKGSVTKDLTVLFSAGDSSKTATAKQRGVKIVPFGQAVSYINKLIG